MTTATETVNQPKPRRRGPTDAFGQDVPKLLHDMKDLFHDTRELTAALRSTYDAIRKDGETTLGTEDLYWLMETAESFEALYDRAVEVEKMVRTGRSVKT